MKTEADYLIGVLRGEIKEQYFIEYVEQYLIGRKDPIMIPVHTTTVPMPTCQEWLEQQNSIENRLNRA